MIVALHNQNSQPSDANKDELGDVMMKLERQRPMCLEFCIGAAVSEQHVCLNSVYATLQHSNRSSMQGVCHINLVLIMTKLP